MKNIQLAKEHLGKVIYGKEEVIDLLFISLLAQGHVLLESVPGTGKTKLAKSFAKVMDGKFARVQFTPDVLPSDVTGIRFFNPKTQAFELQTGPIMTNIFLADEINRATPKTQSSLLEVMEESQATIDGETLNIKQPFIVIATQNPVESNYGTFPLPEAQLDRFLFKIDLGYPNKTEELHILTAYRESDPFHLLQPIITPQEIIQMRKEVKNVMVSDVVAEYLLSLVHASRNHPDVALGISPRGMLGLMRASQAKAYLSNRGYITPDDVKTLAPYLFSHRLILTMESAIKKTTEQITADILDQTSVPVEEGTKT